MKYSVDYEKIYEFLAKRKGKMTSASNIAHFIGVERIYGATMSKLVREGILDPAAEKGYYWIVGN